MTEGAVELSVRWSRRRRSVSRWAFVGFAIFDAAFGVAVVLIARHEPFDAWTIFAVVMYVVLASLLLLGASIVRFRAWLDGQVLVVQGALRRRSIPLKNASFQFAEPEWSYLWRLSPAKVSRVRLRVPTIRVRARAAGQVGIPLVRRDIPSRPGQIHWLPAHELTALADAIEAVATAPNKDRVVEFLRAAAAGTPLVQPTISVEKSW